MTVEHDPMCPWHEQRPILILCYECQLIAKVRADEREQAAQRVEALIPERVITAGGIGYCDALREAPAAARGEL